MRTRAFIGIFLAVALLGCLFFGLWYLGNKKNIAITTARNQILTEALAKEQNLQKLVIKKVDEGSEFSTFDYTNLGTPITLKNIQTFKVLGGANKQTATTEEATAYSLELAEILSPLGLSANTPLKTLLQVYNEGNTTAVVELKEVAAVYQKALGKLLSLRVPEDAAVAHLKLVNAFREVSGSLSAMSQVEKEPLFAAEAGQQYPDFFNRLLSAMNFTNQYLIDRQVKFNNQNKIMVEIPH